MRPDMVILRNVAEAEAIQLRLVPASCGIDRKEDGPGKTCSGETDPDDEFQEAEVEVCIERIMLEDEAVR